MPFPLNATIIDAFPGGNEDPISESGKWAGPVIATFATMRIVSNQLLGNATVDFSEAYLTASYGPECEIYFDRPAISAGANESCELFLKTANPNDAVNRSGYRVFLHGTFPTFDTSAFYETTGNVDNQLGATFTVTLGAGDSIGARYMAGVLEFYRKPSGGSWGLVDSRADTAHQNQSGNMGTGCRFSGTVNSFDNVGGGTLVTTTPLTFTGTDDWAS